MPQSDSMNYHTLQGVVFLASPSAEVSPQAQWFCSAPDTPTGFCFLQGNFFDADCGVDVRVMMSTTVRTDPLSIQECESLLKIPAPATYL